MPLCHVVAILKFSAFFFHYAVRYRLAFFFLRYGLRARATTAATDAIVSLCGFYLQIGLGVGWWNRAEFNVAERVK